MRVTATDTDLVLIFRLLAIPPNNATAIAGGLETTVPGVS